MGRLVLLVAFALASCGETAGTGGSGGSGGQGGAGRADPSPYASKDLWLCRPDIENDHCDMANVTVTQIGPDGALTTRDTVTNPDAKIDCFYLYPSVDHSPETGNTEVLLPPAPEGVEVLQRSAAFLRGQCRLFAPLYHQMTLATYDGLTSGLGWGGWQDSEFFSRAYGDVVEAFDYYMAHHNGGRDFVLYGHSQGAHMFVKLLQDKFDNDEALRGQLLSALLTGPTGFLHVPPGDLVGGTLAQIPLCSAANETGCVIAFDAVAAPSSDPPTVTLFSVPPPEELVRACVNPASFDDGPGTMAELMFPYDTRFITFPPEVETEWVSYPNSYVSQCNSDTRVLDIDVLSEDVPVTPKVMEEILAELGFEVNRLHAIEHYLVISDLVRIVEQQVRSRDE